MSSHRVFIYSLFFLYILFMTTLMVFLGIGIALDRYAFLLLFLALIMGRFKSFILDWFPFILIWLSYDFLRGFADNLTQRVNFVELVNMEKALFWGNISTIELQKIFYHSGSLSFLDYLATIFYFLHFALAESFAFFLWIYDKKVFRQFVTAILTLSFAGFVTYVFFPSAPPWMASQDGYISPVVKIIEQTLKTFPEKLNLPTIYHNFNPNPVAAMPSMHAAYPFLILLFCINYFGKKGLLFLPFVLMVFFSITYLGEHYVVDILGGIIYATIFFMLAKYLFHNVKFHSWPARIKDRQLG